MFVRFQFASATFAEMVRDQLARSDVGCIPPTGSGFVVERIEFPAAGPLPIDVDRSGDLVLSQELVATARAAPAGGPGPSPGPVLDVDAPADRPVAFRLPGGLLDTILGQGDETVTIPVAGGSPVEVRRKRLLLTLPAFLRIRTLDDMVAGSPGPPLLEITIALQLRVDLVHGADGKDRLRVGFHGVGHHEGSDPFVEGIIRNELAGTDVSREVDFDYTEAVLAAVTAMGGGDTTATVGWSGMTLSPDRQFVELRVEVRVDGQAGSSFPDDWVDFYRRQVDDVRTGHDWAVELTAGLLDEVTTAGARAQLAEQEDDFDLAGGGPYVEWRPDYPGFRTTFTGEVIDACSCFGWDIDVNVSVEIKTVLRLAAGGTSPVLEVDSVTSGDATHAGEQACCAITGVMFWPLLGWKYLAEGKVGWGGLALGMFWPVVGSLIVMKYLFDPNPSDEEPAESCRKEGDHQVCSYPVSLGTSTATSPCDQPASTITIDSLRGRNNGLVLAGSVQQEVRSAPQFTVSTPTPFGWEGPRPSCSGPIGDWSAVSTFDIAQVDGGYPLVIGEISGVSWTGGLYQPSITSQSSCPTTAHVRVGTIPYEPGNPFDGSILVLTNVGARMVTVPPVPALTEAEKDAHERFLARWQARFCNILDPGRFERGRMAVAWMVGADDVDRDEGDEGDEGRDGGRGPRRPEHAGDRRLWVVRAFGLGAGEVLTVDDPDAPDREPLARAEALGPEERAVRVDLLHAGDQLHLARSGAGRPRSRRGAAQVRVSVAQLLLREVDARALGRAASGLSVSGPPSAPVLEVEADGATARIALGTGGQVVGGRRRGWDAPVRAPRRPAPDDLAVERRVARPERPAVHYRDRPWTDGLAFVGGGLWARLDDDGATVRTYRVVDSLVL